MSNRGFASDNNAGVHPSILKAMADANHGHCKGYGDDPYTQNAIALFKSHFGQQTEVFFTLTGTGANVLGLNSIGVSVNAVICAQTAHINVDECGAPEKFTGMKLIAVSTPNGKLTPELITPYLHGFGFEHHSQPKIISITQPTELGTLYTVDEIKALSALAKQYNMFLHMDGARISNAAAALNLGFRAFTVDAGVDVLAFGGTKNGLMYGEAVLVFNPQMALNLKYFRKQAMQLASKMRYIGAQFNAFFDHNLWRINAAHANKMAQLLTQKVKPIKGVTITQNVEANGVFAIIPPSVIKPLQQHYFFYVWDQNQNEVRWMCSFDTTPEDIENFAKKLNELCGNV
jgi:threonine aldolase